jgi:hypothetical protein
MAEGLARVKYAIGEPIAKLGKPGAYAAGFFQFCGSN